MNLREAIDYIEEEIAPLEVGTARVINRINIEQDFISRELRIPMQFIENEDATTSFLLPAEARTGGLVRVYDQADNTPIPIYNVATATAKYPSWTEDTFDIKLIVYDPGNATAPIVPTGFTTGDLLRYLVLMKPDDLDSDTDLIFAGIWNEYHSLVPKKVASWFLLHSTNNDRLWQYGTMLRGEFEKEMRSAFAHTWTEMGQR